MSKDKDLSLILLLLTLFIMSSTSAIHESAQKPNFENTAKDQPKVNSNLD